MGHRLRRSESVATASIGALNDALGLDVGVAAALAREVLSKPGMSTHSHTVVWLDHTEAKIFHLDAAAVGHLDVKAPNAQFHVHNKASVSGRRDEHSGEHYYREVVEALLESAEVLVVGPSTAKLELVRYAHKHHADLEKRVVGLETVDHPTDGQLVAYAKKYFIAADRML